MSTIAAGTTTTTALVNTGDTTGNLVFQTNGTTTAMTIDTSQRVGVGKTPVAGRGALQVNGDTETASVNGGQLAGFRNFVINGDFSVWQRGTSFTANTDYTADRWWFVNDAVGASSVSRVNIASLGHGATYCLRATRTSGTNRWVVGTQLESLTLDQMRGKTVTLSLKLRKGADLTSDIGVVFGTSSTEVKFGGVVNDGSFNVPNSSLNTSTFTTVTSTITIPANTAALGVKIELVATQAGATNAFFDVADVQLEVGSVATPFERRSYNIEFDMCRRYFERHNASTNYCNASGLSASTTQTFMSTTYYPKRASPTCTASGTVTDFKLQSSGGTYSSSAAPFLSVGSTTSCFLVGNTTGMTAASGSVMFLTGTATLDYSAEL